MRGVVRETKFTAIKGTGPAKVWRDRLDGLE
jgi:hypothetical protein